MKFSFVVPCFNEIIYIGHCLSSLKALDYPAGDFEVIVVDNGSTDGSLDVARQYADIVLERPAVKVGEVRNEGARQARGEWLVFIDGDCTIEADWLRKAENLIRSNDGTAVFGGGCALPPHCSWIERYWLLEGPEGNALPRDLIGCSILIERDAFIASRGFDPDLSSGEDSELSGRLRSEGMSVKITRDLNIIHWGNAKTLGEFARRQMWHAKSYKNNFRSNMQDPVFLLLLVFLFFLIISFISLSAGFFSFLINLIILLCIPAVLTAKRYLRAKRKPKATELPLAYSLDFIYVLARISGFIKA